MNGRRRNRSGNVETLALNSQYRCYCDCASIMKHRHVLFFSLLKGVNVIHGILRIESIRITISLSWSVSDFLTILRPSKNIVLIFHRLRRWRGRRLIQSTELPVHEINVQIIEDFTVTATINIVLGAIQSGIECNKVGLLKYRYIRNSNKQRERVVVKEYSSV